MVSFSVMPARGLRRRAATFALRVVVLALRCAVILSCWMAVVSFFSAALRAYGELLSE